MRVVLTVFAVPILGHRFAIVVAPPLHLAITRFFLRSPRVYILGRVLASCLTAAFQSGIRTIRETFDTLFDEGATMAFSPTEDHVLSFRCRARKIRRAIDAVCTPRSATRRKLRSGLLLAVRELAPLLYDWKRGSRILCT